MLTYVAPDREQARGKEGHLGEWVPSKERYPPAYSKAEPCSNATVYRVSSVEQLTCMVNMINNSWVRF